MSIQSHNVFFLLNWLQLTLYLANHSSFLMLAIGLSGMEKPSCFPVMHSVTKDDDDSDVMDGT